MNGVYASVSEIVHLLRNAEEYEDLQLQLQRDRSAGRVRNLIEGNAMPSTSFAIAANEHTSHRKQNNALTATSENDLEDIEDVEPEEFAEDEFLANEHDEQNKASESTDAYADDELW